MILLLAIAISLIQAHATGLDWVVGTRVTSPGAGLELATSGAIAQGGSYRVSFMVNSTLLGTFTYGLYDGSDVAVSGKTMTSTLIANGLTTVPITVSVPAGYKFRVVNVSLLLTANVQASVNWELLETEP